MKTISELRHEARECRGLAMRSRSSEQRDLLLAAARQWDALAQLRFNHVRRRPWLAEAGELAEELRRLTGETNPRLRLDDPVPGVAAAVVEPRSFAVVRGDASIADDAEVEAPRFDDRTDPSGPVWL